MGIEKTIHFGLPLSGDLKLEHTPIVVVNESLRSINQWIKNKSQRKIEGDWRDVNEALSEKKWDEAITSLHKVIRKARRKDRPVFRQLLALTLNARAVEQANEAMKNLELMAQYIESHGFFYDDNLRTLFKEYQVDMAEFGSICCKKLTSAQRDLAKAQSLAPQDNLIRNNLGSVEKILSDLPEEMRICSKENSRALSLLLIGGILVLLTAIICYPKIFFIVLLALIFIGPLFVGLLET